MIMKLTKEDARKALLGGLLLGGGGGGRPNMAQAGGKNPEGIPAAVAKAGKVLEAQLYMELLIMARQM